MQTEFFPQTRIFYFPPKREKKYALFPVFLPFSGCKRRCLFCAQDIQTGRAPAPVRRQLDLAGASLEERVRRGLPALELAFFGGTFTALPPDDAKACLDFAAHWREKGAVLSFRCSTRPDCLDPDMLASLAKAGCGMVELGVQSFFDPALARSRRGYTGEQARAACLLVGQSGLTLGIQLMPGMPGLDQEAARRDIALTCALRPALARLYPCLVLAGSALAAIWRAGEYRPWDLPQCVDFLAWASMSLEQEGIPVSRIGLAEEPGLKEQVLAGPRHPALGNMVRSLSLHRALRDRIQGSKIDFAGTDACLMAPRRFQGEFWGHAKALVPAYADLGLTRRNVLWWDRDYFAVTNAGSASFCRDTSPDIIFA